MMTRQEAIEELKEDIELYMPSDPILLDRELPDGRLITALEMAIKALEQEPCEDAISREELLKAVYTWDKFGCDADNKLVQYRDHYIPYIHYDDVVKCIKGMPSVNPQKPKKGYISIDDVMSVFDDFMCGEVDEDGTYIFLEMLKDKAESEE